MFDFRREMGGSKEKRSTGFLTAEEEILTIQARKWSRNHFRILVLPRRYVKMPPLFLIIEERPWCFVSFCCSIFLFPPRRENWKSGMVSVLDVCLNPAGPCAKGLSDENVTVPVLFLFFFRLSNQFHSVLWSAILVHHFSHYSNQ